MSATDRISVAAGWGGERIATDVPWATTTTWRLRCWVREASLVQRCLTRHSCEGTR